MSWNGMFSNLKVSQAAHSELFYELSELNHKERSERLRTLATIGLLFMQESRHIGNQFVSEMTSSAVVASKDERTSQKKSELASRIVPSASVHN